MMAFIRGDLDIATVGSAADWAIRIEEEVPDAIMESAGMGFTNPFEVHFNMTHPPLDKLEVRQALAYATNRDDFREFFGPLYYPSFGLIPPEIFGGLQEADVPDHLRYEHNLEKARELLRQAGYPDGFVLRGAVSSRALYLIPHELLAGMWRRVGVILDFEVVDHAAYMALIREDRNPIVVYPGNRPLGHIFLAHYYHSDAIVTKPTAITNFSHYGDVDASGDGTIDSIDALYDQIVGTVDLREQERLLKEAQIQMLVHLPAFPLFYNPNLCPRRGWVELGYDHAKTPIDYWRFEDAYILANW